MAKKLAKEEEVLMEETTTEETMVETTEVVETPRVVLNEPTVEVVTPGHSTRAFRS
jgi:hypothetical protein